MMKNDERREEIEIIFFFFARKKGEKIVKVHKKKIEDRPD
jgi:hypothetical protein